MTDMSNDTNNLTPGQRLDLVQARAEQWIGWLNTMAIEEADKREAAMRERFPNAAADERMAMPATTYSLDPLTKYVRVVQQYGSLNGNGQRLVHAFYDPRTGDVYKAAGWKAPAKGVRFNLLDDDSFNRMMTVCDRTGGYLYAR